MSRVLRLGPGWPDASERRRIRRARALTWQAGAPPDALFLARPDALILPPGAKGPPALCLVPGEGRLSRRGVLAGRRVVVTRQPVDAAAMVRAVRDAGGRPLPFPLSRTQPLPAAAAIEAISRRPWRFVAITSPRGARYLASLAKEAGLALPPLAAVGAMTRRALARQGLAAEVTASRPSGLGLGAALAGVVGPGDAVLLLRAAEASPDLPQALSAMGCVVEDVALYAARDLVPGTREALGELLAAGAVDWLTFFSGGAARRFAGTFPGGEWRHVPTAVVGPVTGREARAIGFSVRAVAARPSPRAMIEAMCREGEPS